MSDEDSTEDDLARLIEALRQIPDADDPEIRDQQLEMPITWMCDHEGNWSPVYTDGRVGEHSFSFAQMAAFRGEDLGPFLEVLSAAQIVPDTVRTSLDVFSEAWKGLIDVTDFVSRVVDPGPCERPTTEWTQELSEDD